MYMTVVPVLLTDEMSPLASLPRNIVHNNFRGCTSAVPMESWKGQNEAFGTPRSCELQKEPKHTV